MSSEIPNHPEAPPSRSRKRRRLRGLAGTLLLLSAMAFVLLLWFGGWGMGRDSDQLRAINALLWKRYIDRAGDSTIYALADWRDTTRWESLKRSISGRPPTYRTLEDIRSLHLEDYNYLPGELDCLEGLPRLESLTIRQYNILSDRAPKIGGHRRY